MKKYLKSPLNLLLGILLTLGSFSVNAQQPAVTNTPQAAAERQTAKQVELLELDATTAKDLGTLNLAYQEKLNALQRRGNSKKDIEALNRSHSLQMRSLLNVDQYEKYLIMKSKERKEKEKMKANN